jgi:hypothetical protein
MDLLLASCNTGQDANNINCIGPKVRSSYQERFVPRHVRQGQGNALVDLILLPKASIFLADTLRYQSLHPLT